MAFDERSRHDLHGKVEEVLGPEAAATLMALLPPVAWADLATKRDLDHLADRLRADLRAEMNAQLRSIYTAMIATMLGTATLSGTLAFTAARLV